jgi:hypothetical protein
MFKATEMKMCVSRLMMPAVYKLSTAQIGLHSSRCARQGLRLGTADSLVLRLAFLARDPRLPARAIAPSL